MPVEPNLPAADVCPTCKGAEYLRMNVPIGHPRFGKMEPCPDCRGRRVAEELQRTLTATSGLLPGEQGLTLEDIFDRGEGSHLMLTQARRMIERPYGLLTIWGGPGNGKTLTLQVLVNHFMAIGKPAIYARLADLLEYLRTGYDDSEPLKTSARYQKVVTCKLLALDELDKARMTEWAREVVFTLIDDRYRYGRERGELQRHTVIAMNDNPEMALDSYLVSRLRYDLLGPDGFRIVRNADPDAREEGL